MTQITEEAEKINGRSNGLQIETEEKLKTTEKNLGLALEKSNNFTISVTKYQVPSIFFVTPVFLMFLVFILEQRTLSDEVPRFSTLVASITLNSISSPVCSSFINFVFPHNFLRSTDEICHIIIIT